MSRKQRLHVQGPEGSRPFLRGMLTHSLIKQGLNFEEAYSVAKAVKQHLAGRAEVTPEELREVTLGIVEEELGEDRARNLLEEGPGPEPQILHPSGAVPFSRGLLSQKLVGTGLDPGHAYEVAQEVWNRLRCRAGGTIPEKDLSLLVREIVVRRHGEDFGRRYDAIEHIAHSKRPIIVLIGGATGCGKSTLATEIAYRLGIRKISSTDMIREIMRMLLSPDILPAIHTSSYAYLPRLALGEPVIEGFMEQVQRVEVGIAASIRRAVVENFHLIVEGVHVVPPMRAAMQFQDQAHILPVILATLDRSVLESRFIRRGKELGGERKSKRYLESLDNIMSIQDHILDLADQHDVPIIENLSFDEASFDLLRLLTDHLHRLARLEKQTS